MGGLHFVVLMHKGDKMEKAPLRMARLEMFALGQCVRVGESWEN